MIELVRQRLADGSANAVVGRPAIADFEGLLAESTCMKMLFEQIKQLAITDVDVLITGETGCGKELVAQAIHRRSRRSKGPIVAVNCTAIPTDLMESELFGREKGAFTGATTRAPGLLKSAEPGTFFLDEIHELPLPLQGKLLRVLQERKLRHLGATSEVPLNIRVVSAAAMDLRELTQTGRFRADLFYRLNVAHIHLPPLRSRPEDIPLLVQHFCSLSAKVTEQGEEIVIGEDALEVMKRYHWPGNVRELQNTILRLTVMHPGEIIRALSLPEHMLLSDRTHPPAGLRSRGYLGLKKARSDAFERHYLLNLLKRHEGDVSKAAEEAELPRWSLYRLLSKHAISPAVFRSSRLEPLTPVASSARHVRAFDGNESSMHTIV